MSVLASRAEVTAPRSLTEALDFLASHATEGWRPIAGGTDVMVGLEYGRETHARWLDLSRVAPELSAITRDPDGRVRVGGMATMTALRRSALLRGTCSMIGEAAGTVGALQIQNRATVGGNVVNASPAGDTLPVWLVLEAEVELVSAHGSRRVPYAAFHLGYRKVDLRGDELLAALRFMPPPRDAVTLFRKVGTRSAQAISKVVLAALRRTGAGGSLVDVRLAFGSMAPVPVRSLAPIDDVRSTAAYRMRVAENLVREFLAGRLGAAPPRD